MVLSMTTKAQRRKALKTLPTDLERTFEGVIERIQQLPTSQAQLGMKVLMWLHLAYRPLKLRELQHALAVDTEGIKAENEFNADNIPARQILLYCCLGLVIIDKEIGTVRFVHYTLEEYFRPRQRSEKYFPNGYNIAAQACLTYLNFGKLSNSRLYGWLDDRQMKQEYCLFTYAATYWGDYVRCQCIHSDIVTALVIKLLENENKSYLCAVMRVIRLVDFDKYNTPISGALAAAYFGLEEITEYYTRKGEVNVTDSSRRTPLVLAVEKGHLGVVRLLLERNDVDVNAGEPLQCAAYYGHEAVVRLLLERNDVDINATDSSGRTAMEWAIEKGHDSIVQILRAHRITHQEAKG